MGAVLMVASVSISPLSQKAQKGKHYSGSQGGGTVKEATQKSFESLVKYCEEARCFVFIVFILTMVLLCLSTSLQVQTHGHCTVFR